MKNDGSEKLERLLRSAAQAGSDAPALLPFGFDTRVVALARGGASRPNGVTAFVRRVALAAAAVIVVVGIAGFLEISQNSDLDESFSNEFAIADTAIQSEFVK